MITARTPRMKTPRIDPLSRCDQINRYLHLLETALTQFVQRRRGRSILNSYIKWAKTQEIKIPVNAPSFGSNENYPKWSHPLLLRVYYDEEKPLSEKERAAAWKEIQGLTDAKALIAGLTIGGGGRGRNPIGTFCSDVNQFFTQFARTRRAPLADRTLLNALDLLASVTACKGTLATFAKESKRSLVAIKGLSDTPYGIEEELGELIEQATQKVVTICLRDDKNVSSSSTSTQAIPKLMISSDSGLGMGVIVSLKLIAQGVVKLWGNLGQCRNGLVSQLQSHEPVKKFLEKIERGELPLGDRAEFLLATEGVDLSRDLDRVYVLLQIMGRASVWLRMFDPNISRD